MVGHGQCGDGHGWAHDQPGDIGSEWKVGEFMIPQNQEKKFGDLNSYNA
jgi:hypothetical protein